MGDFLDLVNVLRKDLDPAMVKEKWDWESMTPQQFADRVEQTTHCSALIKVTADLSELFMVRGGEERREKGVPLPIS